MSTVILYPKLSNGNILWTCDICGYKAQITTSTRRVSIYCICNEKCNPQCNEEYYNSGEYLSLNDDKNIKKF